MRFRFDWFYMHPANGSPVASPNALTDDRDPSFDPSFDMDRASISSLFTDAALYRDALKGGAAAVQVHKAAAASMNDLADLVGDDLDVPEKDAVGRFAQLAVEDDWALSLEDSRQLVEEPDALSDEESTSSESQDVPTPLSTPPPNTDAPVADQEPISLPPEEVIEILEQEFGALAPKGEEELILEADGAVIQDVVILVRGIPFLFLELRTDNRNEGCNSYHNT